MLSVIGIGPGSQAMMTMEAVEALQAAEIVVGYKTYTHLVKAFTGDKQVIKTGMCKEIERCQAAIELAQAGHNVALISSGDAGIYGMAGLVLELLAPAQRPLQVTSDLSAFWQGSYREVQKEMKGRYPKHVWPDDPANTAPTRRTKKYS